MNNSGELWFWRGVVIILVIALAFSAPRILKSKSDAICESNKATVALIRGVFDIFGGLKSIPDPIKRTKIAALLRQAEKKSC